MKLLFTLNSTRQICFQVHFGRCPMPHNITFTKESPDRFGAFLQNMAVLFIGLGLGRIRLVFTGRKGPECVLQMNEIRNKGTCIAMLESILKCVGDPRLRYSRKCANWLFSRFGFHRAFRGKVAIGEAYANLGEEGRWGLAAGKDPYEIVRQRLHGAVHL